MNDIMKHIPIYLILENEVLAVAEKIGGAALQNLARSHLLHEKSETQHLVWIGTDGTPEYVIAKIPPKFNLWSVAALASLLPQGDYTLSDKYLAKPLTSDEYESLCLGWLLEQYRFNQYKKPSPQKQIKLHYHDAVADKIHKIRDAIFLTRNLINTPPNEMMPNNLADAASKLAQQYDGEMRLINGEDLEQNYPAIHTVGKASKSSPCLIDVRFGDDQKLPLITLVGKGVCFDSGGLDIKSSSNMKLMKKDMGGSACALGLAQLLLANAAKIRLRLLIPAVENAISGNAFRTSDVIKMRSGQTVEVGNTDAEGRLILADSITDACADNPDLLIDLATLTGAARVALGTDMPALFCNDDSIAEELLRSSKLHNDPLWRLPLFEGYQSNLKSDIADLSSTGSSSYGGAITAALFLQQFVKPEIKWLHIDMMAWNLKSLAGRPVGGEAMGLRAIYHLIMQRYN
jgi:leucyl aminopeptidase